MAQDSPPGERPPLAVEEPADIRGSDFEIDFEPPGTWDRRRTRRKLWPNLISSGLEDDQGDFLLLRRLRNVNVTLLIMMAFAVLFGVEAAIVKLRFVGLGALVIGLGAALDLMALRKTRDPVLGGQLAAGLLYAAVLGMNLTRGGFYDISSALFVLVPLVAGLLVGVRVAWVWTAVVCVTGVVLWALPELGVEIVNQIPSDVYFFQALVNRLAILIGAGLLLTLFLESQRKAENEIRDLAFNDSLTGLQNRKSFGDSFAEALSAADRDGKCLALLFVDLDRFKEYNDTLGHAAGDQVLRTVAEVLEGQVRSSDLVAKPTASETVVSRLGGDEFTVILSDIGSKQRAAQAAQRLLDALSKPVTIGGVELFVSASIGVAVYPEDGHDVENRLRRATARNEISVIYQPLYDARSGRIVAAEVLARWQSPSMGEVAPGEFIAIAEESASLINDIGDWVLRAALAQLREWHESGLPRIRMSVNFAAAQLRQLGSVEKVCRFLAEAGIESEFLELEITERIVLGDEEPAMENLRRFRRRGIGIALDDFGTGNASISYLRKLPLSRVKIDRSFVSAITSNPGEANLMSAIVAMAKSLELAVIAEGVESHQQMEYLKTIGCDELQGFFLSRPVRAQEFGELLRRSHEQHPAPLSSPLVPSRLLRP